MKVTFNLSEFRTVNAVLGKVIAMTVVDTRWSDKDQLEGKDLTLEQYNERVEFLRKHDHLFGMNMAREKFKM